MLTCVLNSIEKLTMLCSKLSGGAQQDDIIKWPVRFPNLIQWEFSENTSEIICTD